MTSEDIGTVAETIIQPTFKFVKAGAFAVLAITLGIDVAYFVWLREEHSLAWYVLLLPLVLLAWPAMRALKLRYTRAVIDGDRLRYETGVGAKSTRNVLLSRVQDVRVDQSIQQRMFGVGNISIETAGETSRLVLENIDEPHQVADRLMHASQGGARA